MSPVSDDFLDFLPLFAEETEDVIRARWDAWANEGLTEEDSDEWVDVRDGSHFNINTNPGVREVARVYDLMGSEYVAAAFPALSWNGYLDDLAVPFEIIRLDATPAQGEVTFVAPNGTEIEAGTQVAVEGALENISTQEYETTAGGTVVDATPPPTGLGSSAAAGGGLVAGTYYYVVTAVMDEGETLPSAQKSQVATTAQKITVTWTPIAGAVSYRVYRATVSGGPYSFLTGVTAATVTDDGSITPDGAVHPPAVDLSGNRLTLPVTAVEPGSAGNVGAQAVTVPLTPLAAVADIFNAQPLVGGTDVESDDSLQERLLSAFSGQGPGNKKDYERWARAYLGVGRATVIPLWAGPGTVKVVVLTSDGQPVSTAVVNGLQAFLDPVAGQGEGEAPLGPTVTVTTATAVNVTVSAAIEPEPGYSLDGGGGTVALRSALEAAVADYVNHVEPGGEIVYQKVAGRLIGFQGVHDISGLQLDGGTANVTLTASQVGNLSTITLT